MNFITGAGPAAFALTLLLGCTDRTLPDNEGASSSLDTSAGPSTTDPVSTTAPNPTTMGPNPTTNGPDPMTTGANPTTTGPDPTTGSDPVPTTTAVPSTSEAEVDTGMTGFCGDGQCDDEELCSCDEDCGGCSLPPVLTSGCPAVWSGGSAVAGTTTFGPFAGHTAFFAWDGFGTTTWSNLRLFIFDASVDLAAAKQQPWSNVAYALKLAPGWNQPAWVSTGTAPGWVVQNDEMVETEVLLEVTGTAGNWQRLDPGDPPRLLGSILPAGPNDQAVKGSFDAVFCDAFISQVIPE